MRLCVCLCTVFFVNSLLAQEELGNGYLFPEFEKGTVVLKKGSRVPALLNYQMQVQEMLFIDNDNQILTLTNLPDILFITINERRFVPAPSGSISDSGGLCPTRTILVRPLSVSTLLAAPTVYGLVIRRNNVVVTRINKNTKLT